MLTFPATIDVGLQAGGTTYQQSNESLLEFDGLTADETGLSSFLGRSGLSFVRRSPLVLAHRLSESGLLRLPKERAEEMAAMMERRGAIARLAPLYYEKGQGPESAAYLVSGAVTLDLAPGANGGAVASWLLARGFQPDIEFSRLIAPYLYFYRPAGSPPAPTPFDLDQFLRELRGLPGVASADFDWVKSRALASPPNDDLWVSQTDMVQIGMDKVFATLPSKLAGVKIAVLDTGFDFNHPDLNFAPSSDRLDLVSLLAKVAGGLAASPDARHGTEVAGISAAIANNKQGIAGVASGFPIVPVSLGSYPTAAELAAGLRWAIAHGAGVVNMSFSAVRTDCANDALLAAWGSGLVLCAAAGNAGTTQVDFPASHPNVIGIGAADQQGLCVSSNGSSVCFDDSGAASRWGSQYGTGLSLLAPGVSCWTTLPLSAQTKVKGYGTVCGTSVASPHVAGLAALLRSVNPSLSNAQVREFIESNCQKVGAKTYTYGSSSGHPHGKWCNEAGYGLVDCYATLNAATTKIAFAKLRASACPDGAAA